MRDECGSGDSGSSGDHGLVYRIHFPSKSGRKKRKSEGLSEPEETNICNTLTEARLCQRFQKLAGQHLISLHVRITIK